jgi:hypothetical protein
LNPRVRIDISSTAKALLFQTPVPNYTDVDLSFSYKYFHSALDFTAMGEASPYEAFDLFIPVMNKMVEYQLSSPQLQEFIRLAYLGLSLFNLMSLVCFSYLVLKFLPHAVHILQENHENGPMDKTMEILKVANKGKYLDIWEILYIYIYIYIYIYMTSRFKHVLNEQRVGETNVLFNLLINYDHDIR